MNFARFCFTLATFPTRYALHRIGQAVENALWSEDLDVRIQAATLDHANARTTP